eukprot:1531777-Rhodomonas_salina.1
MRNRRQRAPRLNKLASSSDQRPPAARLVGHQTQQSRRLCDAAMNTSRTGAHGAAPAATETDCR